MRVHVGISHRDFFLRSAMIVCCPVVPACGSGGGGVTLAGLECLVGGPTSSAARLCLR